MKVIELQEEAIPFIVSTIYLKKNLLQDKLKYYNQELKAFEKRHKMSSPTFYQKFNDGTLGDDKIWFKWTYLYETTTILQNELNLIASIRL
ncbi:MAG: hypothetical protein ABH870_00770 [bacterium]